MRASSGVVARSRFQFENVYVAYFYNGSLSVPPYLTLTHALALFRRPSRIPPKQSIWFLNAIYLNLTD